MKYIFWICVIITLFFILVRISDYDGRMKAYNKHMCAVYGYKPDCRTPLPPEERLK